MASQGLKGGGDKSHQPPHTLHTSPHARYDCDSEGREPDPPPLLRLRNVSPMGSTQQTPPHNRPIYLGVGTEAPEAGRGRGMEGG